MVRHYIDAQPETRLPKEDKPLLIKEMVHRKWILIGWRIPDPHDGHVPPDENLAACPCDPPSGPCEGKFFTPRRHRHFSKSGGPVPPFPEDNVVQRSRSKSPNIGQRPKPTLSFSKPKPGNFSYRRRRPDVNALREIILSLNPTN